MPNTTRISSRHFGLGLALLASSASLSLTITELLAQDPFVRSVADQLPRPSDELARPRQAERTSHRGFEFSDEHICIVSTGSAEEGRFALREAQSAWQDISVLVDYISARHRHPDFALGAVQVTINSDPPKQRNESSVLLQLAGHQNSVELYAETPQQLELQRQPLRAAVAASLLRSAEIDRHVPDWVSEGLASFAASQGLLRENVPAQQVAASEANIPSGGIGLAQWRGKRTAPDQIGSPTAESDLTTAQSAKQITFLLAGEDAEHAATFLAVLKHVIDTGDQTALADRPVRTRPEHFESPTTNPLLANYLQSLDGRFAAWQKDPQTGIPHVEGQLSPDKTIADKQRQLIFILKLCHRLHNAKATSTSKVSIKTFSKETGVAQPVEPLAGNAVADDKTAYPKITSTKQLLALLDRHYGNAPFSTLAPNGHLLVSSVQRDELESILAIDDHVFRFSPEAGTPKVTIALSPREEMHGWLEEDPGNPSRPLVRFSLAGKGAPPQAAATKLRMKR